MMFSGLTGLFLSWCVFSRTPPVKATSKTSCRIPSRFVGDEVFPLFVVFAFKQSSRRVSEP